MRWHGALADLDAGRNVERHAGNRLGSGVRPGEGCEGREGLNEVVPELQAGCWSGEPQLDSRNHHQHTAGQDTSAIDCYPDNTCYAAPFMTTPEAVLKHDEGQWTHGLWPHLPADSMDSFMSSGRTRQQQQESAVKSSSIFGWHLSDDIVAGAIGAHLREGLPSGGQDDGVAVDYAAVRKMYLPDTRSSVTVT